MPVSKRTREKGWSKNKKHYHGKISEGLCTTWLCTKLAEDGLRWCRECGEKEKERSKQRLKDATAIGKCCSCPNEAMQLLRGTRSNGLGGQFVEGRTRASYCQKCHLKAMAAYHLGSRKHWTILVEKLDACGWKCSYTGETLVVGDNLTFDHMYPISRFPELEKSPDNLEPVSWRVNIMKRDLTKQEFLDLIRKISTHCNQE